MSQKPTSVRQLAFMLQNTSSDPLSRLPSLPLCLSVPSLCLSMSVCLSLCLYLCLSSVSVSLSLCVSLPLCLYPVSLSVSVYPVSLSVCLCLSVCLSLQTDTPGSTRLEQTLRVFSLCHFSISSQFAEH